MFMLTGCVGWTKETLHCLHDREPEVRYTPVAAHTPHTHPSHSLIPLTYTPHTHPSHSHPPLTLTHPSHSPTLHTHPSHSPSLTLTHHNSHPPLTLTHPPHIHPSHSPITLTPTPHTHSPLTLTHPSHPHLTFALPHTHPSLFPPIPHTHSPSHSITLHSLEPLLHRCTYVCTWQRASHLPSPPGHPRLFPSSTHAPCMG